MGLEIGASEYFPFGESSFGSFGKKRYRYVGKEKDEESGMYYYGARYYAPYQFRFLSVDPLALDYPQLTPFNYAGNKPVGDIDVDGLQGTSEETLSERDQSIPKDLPQPPMSLLGSPQKIVEDSGDDKEPSSAANLLDEYESDKLNDIDYLQNLIDNLTPTRKTEAWIAGFHNALFSAASYGLADFWSAEDDYKGDNKESYLAGRIVGDVAVILASIYEIQTGAGITTGGGAATATGIGAVAGVPAMLVGVGVSAHGFSLTAMAGMNLGQRLAEYRLLMSGKSKGKNTGKKITQTLKNLTKSLRMNWRILKRGIVHQELTQTPVVRRFLRQGA